MRDVERVSPAGARALAVERRVWLSRRRTERVKIGFVFALLCALGAAVLVPIVWMVSTSLKVDTQIFTNPPTWIPNPMRWHNYVDALSNFDFLLNLKNTLTITVPAVTGTLLS